MNTTLFAAVRRAFLLSLLAATASAAPLEPLDVVVPLRPGVAPSEPAALSLFRASAGGDVTPVLVELKGAPTAVANARAPGGLTLPRQIEHSLGLWRKQDEVLASLPDRGVRAWLKQVDVKQVDGSTRNVQFRLHYLTNGFVAYVATADIARLRALPEVRSVRVIPPTRLMMNKAIDYSLGTSSSIPARRQAVYGATEEFAPEGSAGHPETPKITTLDGYEGQDMNIAVIDTGVDWRHPMFGGTGNTTPQPRTSGNAEAPGDNTKVIYYYALSSPGDPTDDYGHGSFVASNAAGYVVDGNTPAIPGYGTGTGGAGVGPTPNGVTLHGTAPQARLMAYKVCGPSDACAGEIPLAIDDAASPFTLLADGTPTPVAKPVADVINLSLGGGSGTTAPDAFSSTNAALAGVIVVASAGNDGPGPSTVSPPCVSTLAICVGASLDPGSLAAGDMLAAGQIPGETNAGQTPAEGAAAGPPAEFGPDSDANTPEAGERQAIRLFLAAGGGPIPQGSVSAHYVYADMINNSDPPPTVTNRVALVDGTGAFATIANSVAPLNPVAILIITDIESATAVSVLGGIPTYTIPEEAAAYLIDLMRTGDDDSVNVPHGTVSELPMRVAESATLDSFVPGMAGFSSRGPNNHETAAFRTIKPDVTGPGVGILAATTPDGTPEAAAMSTPVGYTHASGTSFSGPITAGAMALLRQHVRETLGFDTADQADPDYRSKRFNTVTVARALLQNTATNLRSGHGVPLADAATPINDQGSGHINIAAALDAKAIMVTPVLLLADADPDPDVEDPEFTPPTLNPPALDEQGNLEVLIPTGSFGAVPVVGVDATLVKTVKVIVRDVTGGGGSGGYNLTFQNVRLADQPGFAVSFLGPDQATETTLVEVPSGGDGIFYVRVAADGSQIVVPNSEFQWYVTATHAGTGRTLRMPFYYRAVAPQFISVAAPVQEALSQVETPGDADNCATDSNGAYAINFTYTVPAGGETPSGFRVQEATKSEQVFLDEASQALVAGANDTWSGSEQWSTSVHPDTGTAGYYIPDAAEQNEALTMVGEVAIPASGGTLSYDSFESTEATFDFVHLEVSTDQGATFKRIASFSGDFSGTRQFDLSGFAGQSVKLQLRMTSDQNVSGPGWWVDNIRISADDYETVGNPPAGATSQPVTEQYDGSYLYRVAAVFDTPLGQVAGPYSNVQCVTAKGFGPPPGAYSVFGGALPPHALLLALLLGMVRRARRWL